MVLAPFAGLAADVYTLRYARFSGSGSAWVDPRYELSLRVSFNGAQLCSGSYAATGRGVALSNVTGEVTPAAQGKWTMTFVATPLAGGDAGKLDIVDFGMNFQRSCLVRAGSAQAAELKLTTRVVESGDGVYTLYVETTNPR